METVQITLTKNQALTVMRALNGYAELESIRDDRNPIMISELRAAADYIKTAIAGLEGDPAPFDRDQDPADILALIAQEAANFGAFVSMPESDRLGILGAWAGALGYDGPLDDFDYGPEIPPAWDDLTSKIEPATLGDRWARGRDAARKQAIERRSNVSLCSSS